MLTAKPLARGELERTSTATAAAQMTKTIAAPNKNNRPPCAPMNIFPSVHADAIIAAVSI